MSRSMSRKQPSRKGHLSCPQCETLPASSRHATVSHSAAMRRDMLVHADVSPCRPRNCTLRAAHRLVGAKRAARVAQKVVNAGSKGDSARGFRHSKASEGSFSNVLVEREVSIQSWSGIKKPSHYKKFCVRFSGLCLRNGACPCQTCKK